MPVSIYVLNAREFTVYYNHRYVGFVVSQPLKGAVGTNGRKGGWVINISNSAADVLPAYIKALDGARFIRSTEAFDALKGGA